MKISRLIIENFRGIKTAELFFPDHVVLIGDNNTGKSTILEAINLVLGPDRLNRRPPIDEHDFYVGRYFEDSATGEPAEEQPVEPDEAIAAEAVVEEAPASEPVEASVPEAQESNEPEIVQIRIEATITDLSDEQKAHFRDYIEWWNTQDNVFYIAPKVEGVDDDAIVEALRVTFIGEYEFNEDDFIGNTYFSRSLEEGGAPQFFGRRDKQFCGFLYLRSLRTGSRALSLEHGSLLDIILRLKEIRPQMWESTISGLASFDVASAPELGITGVLQSINTALKKYVPKEWGVEPHLRVSALTREHLRKVITAFVATGEGPHATPYYRQGTGTINMLVLAMLSQIAEDKQNVIFAMEEPETAIPPYAQKRIVHEIRNLSAQSLFTSHSPYVLEEFGLDETLVLSRSGDGVLMQAVVSLPESVKQKRYRQEFRTRFCEGLLARRILLAEGATEATAFPAVARRLAELDPAKYNSLEALGICTINAGTESQLADLGGLYRGLGKTVYAVCDSQTAANEAAIRTQVDELFMHNEKGIEDLVLNNTTAAALERFADILAWPPHLAAKYPDPKVDIVNAVGEYLGWAKGNWGLAEFLAQCNEDEIPEWTRETCIRIRELSQPVPEEAYAKEEPAADEVIVEPGAELPTEDVDPGGV
ncbi:ATP-dependent endonuclease [Thiolapillus sp.]|uniref:ATP-dependent nuclease n=1 Tax=Thiolapillus sp. TaxID=2017437 RepID=UPI0025E4EA66|nr:AAA family ATPase [Thiolapillus sp.]